MGYEVAGALGVKLAAPEREVYVMVGDGSYLMLSSEIVTAGQEGLKLTIVLVDNHGFKSIGSLSRALGTDGFGTLYRYRDDGSLGVDSEESAAYLPLDLAANAESLGAKVFRAATVDELRAALESARGEGGDVRFLGTDPYWPTPPTFCEVWPPDRFPITFYRKPTAPDWQLSPDDFDADEVANARLLYATGTGLAQSPSRETTLEALRT